MVYPSMASKPKGASQLVSTPATSAALSFDTPYHPLLSRSVDENPYRQVTPDAPSDEQRAAAIGCLQAFDEGTILAWLTLVRSLQPGTTLRAGPVGPGCLTNEHFKALSTLSTCHDVDIQRVIELALRPSSCCQISVALRENSDNSV
jgi:hypothetical protein